MKGFVPFFLLLLICVSTKAQTVFKTPSGQKYHLANCRMVKNVSTELSVKEAGAMGLEPCKICKPQMIAVSQMSKKPHGLGNTTQCKGITKKGTRCLHMTRIANGYCFQHDPNKLKKPL